MSPPSRLTELRLRLGIERNTTRHGEKWISGIGARSASWRCAG